MRPVAILSAASGTRLILPEKMTLSRFATVQWISVVGMTSLLLYLLGPVLMPFAVAAILAYIGNPLVRRLCRWGFSRQWATVSVMVGMLAIASLLLLITLPLLETESRRLLARLPQWVEAARLHWLPLLQQWFGAELQWDGETLKQLLFSHWQSAGGAAAKLLPVLGGGGGLLLAALANLLLIPVALFYLLRDWEDMLGRLDALVPRAWHAKVLEIAMEVDAVLAEFLRGQLAVILLMSFFYVLALWLAGLEFALPIGLLAGMLVFVPYLGMLTGLLLATLAAAMQFVSFGGVLLIWAVFGVGQLLEGMVVTPWLVGDRIGLHPLAVVFALMASGQLFGFFGVLLALPLAAVLLVALRHAKSWYLSSGMYRSS